MEAITKSFETTSNILNKQKTYGGRIMISFYLKNKQATLDLFETNNYSMLHNFGMVLYKHKRYSFSDNVIVIRDDDERSFVGKPKVFHLSDLLQYMYYVDIYKMMEAIENIEKDLGKLRLYFAFFKYQEDGKLALREDNWFKIKAWRYDIHDDNYTLRQVVELCDKLPLFPSYLKKSRKGWHLIYVFYNFIERSYVENYKNHDTRSFLHYNVYKILTEKLPFYLKTLEPKVNVQDSKNISRIFTRFNDGNMPCYWPVFNRNINDSHFYALETFYNAYSFLL
jgi:hypothetical protein